MALYEIISSFETFGVFDVALPFILIFTIAFAVMQKIQLFGANKKNIDLIVSLVLAFLAIRNIFLIGLLNRFLPNIAMFLIIILMFLLLLGTFGGQFSGFSGYMGVIAAIISLIFVIISLSGDFLDLQYGIILPPFLADLFYDYQTKATILFVAGIAIVIWLVTGSSTTTTFSQTLNDIWTKLVVVLL